MAWTLFHRSTVIGTSFSAAATTFAANTSDAKRPATS